MSYSPSLGRWITEDPELFDAGDMDLYRMEGNDPINRLDPSGLFAVMGGLLRPPDKGGAKMRLTKEPGIDAIDANEANEGKKVGTISDGKGNVLEVWVVGRGRGRAFAGRLAKDKKPFGKCLPPGGINHWVAGETKIYWYNIGPNLNAAERRVIDNAIGRGDGKGLPATATFDDIHKFMMNSLLQATSKNYLTILDPTDNRQIAGLQAFETVLYVMEATDKGVTMQVFRLYKDMKTGGLVWKVDGVTKVGADPSLFP